MKSTFILILSCGLFLLSIISNLNSFPQVYAKETISSKLPVDAEIKTHKLGDIMFSILEPAEFIKLHGQEWSELDGSSVIDYELGAITQDLPNANNQFIKLTNGNVKSQLYSQQYPAGSINILWNLFDEYGVSADGGGPTAKWANLYKEFNPASGNGTASYDVQYVNSDFGPKSIGLHAYVFIGKKI